MRIYKSIDEEGNIGEEITRNFHLLKYEIETLKSNQKVMFEMMFELLKQQKVKDSKLIYFVGKYKKNQKRFHQTDAEMELKANLEKNSPDQVPQSDFFNVQEEKEGFLNTSPYI